MLPILLFVVLAAAANAQLTGVGPCPEVVPTPTFDGAKMKGQWYVNEYSCGKENNKKCLRATVGLSEGEKRVFTLKAKYFDTKDHVLITMQKKAVESRSGVLKNKLCEDCARMKILALTDDFMVFYKCKQNGEKHEIYAGIKTREIKPTEAVLKKAHDVLTTNKIKYDTFKKVDHTDCDKLLE